MQRVAALAEPGSGHTPQDRGWHAIYTRHQHEKTIAGNLRSKGFEIFLPQYSSARRWKDRTKQLWLPLFPCYVFLHGGLDRWLEVLSTPGVVSIVGNKSRPAVIPQPEIDAVRRVVDEKLRMEPHPFLRCGDWVRVKWGVLEGIEGILVRKKNLFRLVISVEILQKSVAIEVDAAAVERAEPPHADATRRALALARLAHAWV